MQNLKVRGPFGSLDFQTLLVLGPLQKLLHSHLYFAVVTFLTKIQIWCYKTNKKTCQNTIIKKIWMGKTTTVQKIWMGKTTTIQEF